MLNKNHIAHSPMQCHIATQLLPLFDTQINNKLKSSYVSQQLYIHICIYKWSHRFHMCFTLGAPHMWNTCEISLKNAIMKIPESWLSEVLGIAPCLYQNCSGKQNICCLHIFWQNVESGGFVCICSVRARIHTCAPCRGEMEKLLQTKPDCSMQQWKLVTISKRIHLI